MKSILQKQLISLLISATKQGVMSWNSLVGDCYVSNIGSRTYHLHWLHWDGIFGASLDRRGLVVSTPELHLPLLSATPGMEVAERLLEQIDPKWEKYHLRVRKGCLSMLPDDAEGLSLATLNLASIQALASMLQATKRGLMEWHRFSEDPDIYYSVSSSRKIGVEFLSPVDSNDTPLRNMIAKVSLNHVNLSFACGTGGIC